MVSGIVRFFGRAKNAMQAADDAANAAKQAAKVQLKPANKAAEKMGLANYGREYVDYSWGRSKRVWTSSLDGQNACNTTYQLNYRNCVLGLPEGQVVTKSGKVYTRTMGANGQRIYTDANGNVTTFNNHRYELPWRAENLSRSSIYRQTPDGGLYGISHTTQRRGCFKGEQEVSRFVVQDGVNGLRRNVSFRINPNGNIAQHQIATYNPSIGVHDLTRYHYGAKTDMVVPKNASSYSGCYSTATPKWTSLGNYS